MVLARDGYLAFAGPAEEACRYFAVERLDEIYGRLERDARPEEWARRFKTYGADEEATSEQAAAKRPLPGGRHGVGFVRQWGVLTQRTLETLARNPLTMAILLGSPAMVVAMFVILFRSGALTSPIPAPAR